jgi:hypothetical protein
MNNASLRTYLKISDAHCKNFATPVYEQVICFIAIASEAMKIQYFFPGWNRMFVQPFYKPELPFLSYLFIVLSRR